MKKFDIVIDCDGVLVDTTQMFVKLNNKLNNQNDNYKDAEDWNFIPCCKNLKNKEEVDNLFNHPELYENPIFFDNAIKVIKRLNKKYNIAICTMGQHENIINKLNMLKKYLPEINILPIVSNFNIPNKDFIKTRIIIDDHIKNLSTTKAKLPILFEPNQKYKWNAGWEGYTALNWLDFERMCYEWIK